MGVLKGFEIIVLAYSQMSLSLLENGEDNFTRFSMVRFGMF